VKTRQHQSANNAPNRAKATYYQKSPVKDSSSQLAPSHQKRTHFNFKHHAHPHLHVARQSNNSNNINSLVLYRLWIKIETPLLVSASSISRAHLTTPPSPQGIKSNTAQLYRNRNVPEAPSSSSASASLESIIYCSSSAI